MTKNKLEKKFSKSLKEDSELWGMKLHNNMLAHQTTPADYILTHNNGVNLKVILVECKQVTLKDGKGRFAFKRMKQMHDLLAFEHVQPLYHISYVCLAYLEPLWKDTDVYIIPASEFVRMLTIEQALGHMSINRQNAKVYFGGNKAEYDHQCIQLENIKS